jgi:hypothetical protein
MNITLCGSIAFIDEMDAARKELESMGHAVKMPPLEIMDGDGQLIPVKEYYALRKAAADDHEWIWKRKAEAIRAHFDKVVWADAILVLNHDKNGVAAYIGANALGNGAGLSFQKTHLSPESDSRSVLQRRDSRYVADRHRW